MFLIDNILLSPVRGIVAAFREIHNAVQQESADEAEAIRARLSELYMLLETQRITDEEFDREEKELLDRLDEIDSAPEQVPSPEDPNEMDTADARDEDDADDVQEQDGEEEEELEEEMALVHDAIDDCATAASEYSPHDNQ